MAQTTEEDKCAPFSYITGGVTISPKPPPDFTIGINILVGALQAALKGPTGGDNHVLWRYLVVVRPGPTSVRCLVGDITIEKSIEARPGRTEIVNFCLGRPVTIEPKGQTVSEFSSCVELRPD